MKTTVIRLDFNIDRRLVGHDVNILHSTETPSVALDAKGDHLDQEVFPMFHGEFEHEFKQMMNTIADDELTPCSFWIIKWGDLIGMAAASRIAHPECRLLVNQQPVG